MQICRELAGIQLRPGRQCAPRYEQEKAQGHGSRSANILSMDAPMPGKECAGCVKNGIPEAVANQIYDDMISFASYAFNKSHAACYAYVAYPDSLPQVPLPPRVHGRPADQRTR